METEGLHVMLFRRSEEEFPMVRRTGDIIRFHRLVMNECVMIMIMLSLFDCPNQDVFTPLSHVYKYYCITQP